MKLHYQTYFDQTDQHAANTTPILIIPGLFGSSGNWRGFAKKLSQHYNIIVVDQRNHGDSPHSPSNAYQDLVADIVELLDDLELEKVTLCGHSMGGKTAMMFALTHPERLEKLIVLDIAPVTYTHSHAPILQGLLNVDLSSAKSRADVEQQLVSAIPDKSTRLFIMLSLSGKPGAYFWKLNASGLYDNLVKIGGFPVASLQGQHYPESCLFLKGGKSEYVAEEHYSDIYHLFPQATISVVDNAGHWLHVDSPEAVLAELLTFMKKE